MGKIKKIKWVTGGDMSDWLRSRQEMEGLGYDYTRIGASDVSVIMGTNPWKEKRRLFMHLTSEHSNFQMTETTLAGHLSEPLIAQRWESYVHGDDAESWHNALNGIRLRKLRKANFFVTNSDYPNFFISLDYVPWDKTQFSPFTGEQYHPLTPHEFKATNKDYYRLWTNGVARAYYDQVQTQMALTETKLAVFHVLVDGVKYVVKEIERDEERIKQIKYEVDEFIKLVNDGKAALWGAQNAPDPEMREHFRQLYEDMKPEFTGTKDGVTLADETWKASTHIDKDAAFKIADENDEAMLEEYWGCLRQEEYIDKQKNILAASLKTKASGFEGIKGSKYKLTNRAATATKGKYFSVREITNTNLK